jgi:hypothetical protein
MLELKWLLDVILNAAGRKLTLLEMKLIRVGLLRLKANRYFYDLTSLRFTFHA